MELTAARQKKTCFVQGSGEALARFTRGAVAAPSLGVFKAMLDGVWSHLV